MPPRGKPRGGAGKSSTSSNKDTPSRSLRSASGSGKSTPKASAKATAQEPSESEFEPDATPSPGQKRSNKPRTSEKKVQRFKVTETPKVSGRDALSILELDRIAITPDESTIVLNCFINLIEDQNLRDVLPPTHKYTPTFDFDTESVFDMPPYDDKTRCYVMQEEEVILYDHNLPDGSTAWAWRLQAKNIRDVNAQPVNLFVLNAAIPATGCCPPCGVKNNKANWQPCHYALPVCGRCHRAGEDAHCVAIRAIEHVGPNLIHETFCSDQALVAELGRIKVDIMNRMPEELDVDGWETPIYFNNANSRVSVSDLRAFIDVTSLPTWKRLHNPTIDLNTMQHSVNGKIASVWSRRACMIVPTAIIAAKQIRIMPFPGAWIPPTSNAKSLRNGKNYIYQIPVDISWVDDFNTEMIKNPSDHYGILTLEFERCLGQPHELFLGPVRRW